MDDVFSPILDTGKEMLSNAVLALNAKTDRDDETLWLPLVVHLRDTAEVMEYLLRHWLPEQYCEGLDLSREEIQERASEYLAYFHLDEYEERIPFELSGGEKQRLVLAAVLAMQPKFLILDEPTAALDVYRRSLLGRRLRKIKHGLGCGVLIVSHDMDFIKTYCDRIVKMETAEGGGICASLI